MKGITHGMGIWCFNEGGYLFTVSWQPGYWLRIFVGYARWRRVFEWGHYHGESIKTIHANSFKPGDTITIEGKERIVAFVTDKHVGVYRNPEEMPWRSITGVTE